MGHVRVVSLLAFIAVASASIGDNSLDGGERVVLVAPVLAPPRDSRTHVTDRARQFPILVLLAQQQGRAEPSSKSLKGQPEPIYVQKLEDQEKNPAPLNRQKRTLKKFFGGGGYGHGGGYGGYQQQPQTIVIIKERGRGRGHHGGGGCGGGGCGGNYGGGYGQGGGYGHGGGYGQGGGYGGHPGGGGCNGGCGGGYGGSYATATATATASASSYGKKR